MLMSIMTTKLLPLFLVFFVLVLPFTYPLCHLKNDRKLNYTKEQTQMKIWPKRRVGDLDSIYLKIKHDEVRIFPFLNITQLIKQEFWIRMAVTYWPDPDPFYLQICNYIYGSVITCTDPDPSFSSSRLYKVHAVNNAGRNNFKKFQLYLQDIISKSIEKHLYYLCISKATYYEERRIRIRICTRNHTDPEIENRKWIRIRTLNF